MQEILVLGAGELGSAIVTALVGRVASGFDARLSCLLRPSTATAQPGTKPEVDTLREQGVQLVSGDLAESTAEQLAATFRVYDVVLSCTGFAAGRGTQLKLAKAAVLAEVPRYFPWQFGVSYDEIGRGSAQDLFDEQIDVRDLLRSQERTQWTVISTGIFSSFFFDSSFGVVDLPQRTIRALGGWDHAITITAVEDIAALTAEVVASSDLSDVLLEGHLVYTAGDTFTYEELYHAVSRKHPGISFKKEAWTVAVCLEELAKAPDDVLWKYRAVFSEGKGVSWPKERTINHIRRTPTRSAFEVV